MKRSLTLVMATDIFGNLGYDNNLVYRSKEDMRFFMSQTKNSILLMGRKTYDSLPNPQPLIDRNNKLIVFSRSPRESEYSDVHYFVSPQSFMEEVGPNLSAIGATKEQGSSFISMGGSTLFSLGFLEGMEQYFDSVVLYLNIMKRAKLVKDTESLVQIPLESYQEFFDSIETQESYNDFLQVKLWKNNSSLSRA